MQYNQPFDQPSSPNAGYTDGNPSTGANGSIPPAASIEFPQREIVNFETDSGLTPTNSDLHQLSEAVQSGAVCFGLDTGTTNNLYVTLVPVPPAVRAGLEVRVKIAYANTGSAVLTLNGILTAPVVHADLTPLVGLELAIGMVACFIFDGSNFQLLNYLAQKRRLAAPMTFYIAITGNDTTGNGTAALPWLTKQHAYDFVQANYDLNGQVVTFQMDDSVSYTDGLLAEGPIVGQAGPTSVIFQGNVGAANNVVITSVGNCYNASYGANFIVQYQNLNSSSFNCLFAGANSNLVVGAGITFGTATLAHMACSSGQINIAADYNFSGSATNHMLATDPGAEIVTNGPFSGTGATLAFTTFALAVNLGMIKVLAMTYPGCASLTGQRYSATIGGVINTNGGGSSYFPGNSNGATSTGGQYV